MEFVDGMPKTLFKYRDYDLEYNRNSLFEFELYFPSANNLNDPYEGSIPFRYNPDELSPEKIFLKQYNYCKAENPKWTEEQIHEFCFRNKDNVFDPENMEKVDKLNRETICRDFGILSLSSDPMNYLMWSYYTHSHTGFCLGYDTVQLFNSCTATLSKVNYTDEIPKHSLNEDIAHFHQKQLSTKGKFWEHESEYRLIRIKGANSILKIEPVIITSIFLGCNMIEKTRFKIIDFAKKHLNHASVYELSLDQSLFKLNGLKIL